MGIFNSVKGQFIDVIEYVDDNSDIIVKKYIRVKDDDEIKWGAKLIVRESQSAIFLKGGEFADVFNAGTYTLSAENLPIISKVMAVPYALNSPIKADVYFVSLKQFLNQNWGTKNPIIMRDKEFDVVRVRAFGNYAFKIIEPKNFMQQVFGTQKKYETKEIKDYLTSFIIEAFSIVMGESDIPVLDLSTKYRELSQKIQERANEQAKDIGVEFSNIIIENISLPENVEKIIDEKSSVGVVKNDFQNYSKFESIQAMRDAAKQENGLAGLSAGAMASNELMKNMKSDNAQVKIRCTKCNSLNDENAKFCSNCGTKLEIDKTCSKCGLKLKDTDKFCPNCGTSVE